MRIEIAMDLRHYPSSVVDNKDFNNCFYYPVKVVYHCNSLVCCM